MSLSKRHGLLYLLIWLQMIWMYLPSVICGETDVVGDGLVYTTQTEPSTTTPRDWIEMDVRGFRVWMIIGLVLVGLMIVVIALCCIFDCRIPRTKQEIEAENNRKQAAKAEFVNAAQRVRKAQKTFRAARALKSAMALPDSPVTAPQETAPRDVDGIEVEVSSAGPMGAPVRTSSQTSNSALDADFQLYEKPPNYGRRIRYQPSVETGPERTSSKTSRQFRPDPDATAHVLSSLPRQANSNV